MPLNRDPKSMRQVALDYMVLAAEWDMISWERWIHAFLKYNTKSVQTTFVENWNQFDEFVLLTLRQLCIILKTKRMCLRKEIYLCVCVCVCVCVCKLSINHPTLVPWNWLVDDKEREREWKWVCVCVCVCGPMNMCPCVCVFWKDAFLKTALLDAIVVY